MEFNATHFNKKLCDVCTGLNLKKCNCCKRISNIYTNTRSHGHVCEECYNTKVIPDSHITYNDSNTDSWIECKICNVRTKEIAPHLKAVHKISFDEYVKLYPDTKSKSKDMCERVAGDKNPAYQHGGTHSPFSDKSAYHSNDDMIEIRQRARANATKNINGAAGSTKLENYIATGMSEEDAKIALSERQSTFSLEKCIEKHGETEGINIWNDRQTKWQNTLNAKPEEELQRINRLKVGNGASISKTERDIVEYLKLNNLNVETQLQLKKNNKGHYLYDMSINKKDN